MKLNTRTSRLVLITLLSLAVLAVGLWAAGSAIAGPAAQGGPIAAIPYQGRLTGDDGQPVADGAYDFTFEVYEALTGGAPLWAETQTGVAVRDGYFSVLLGSVNPLGADAAASDRYLAVAVRGPGEDGFTALEPRQKLPDPTVVAQQVICGASATHDHWGETWSGTGTGLTLNSSDGYGFIAETSVTEDYYAAVRGRALGTTGTNYGVYGSTNSSSGYGVYGYNFSTTGETAIGVRGQTESSSDGVRGVLGWATAATGATEGVRGQTESSSDGAKGVLGYARATSGETYGIYGWSKSTSGTGVYGQATADSGRRVGIRGVGDVSSGLNPGYVEMGVWGDSQDGVGVIGTSVNSRGVWGLSTNDIGVRGFSQNGVGVVASSESGNPLEAYGAGSTDCEFKVDNDGDVWADRNYYGAGGVFAGSADFAEMVQPGQSDLVPGDVLVIGADGRMVRSAEAYQSTVIGVYSTEPGFVGGNKLDEDGNPLEPERIPLALVGIVPVKASAEKGSIQPGDLLVASSTPGHAMKAGPNPPVGTVIGKALGSLDSGTGVIEMLVMLQ